MPLCPSCHLAVLHFLLQYPYVALHILGFQLPCLFKTWKLQKGMENEEDIEEHLILHSAKENNILTRNRRMTRRESKGKSRKRGRFNFNFLIIVYPTNFYTVAMPFKCKHKAVSYNFSENWSDVLYLIKCVAATGSIVEKNAMLYCRLGNMTLIGFFFQRVTDRSKGLSRRKPEVQE